MLVQPRTVLEHAQLATAEMAAKTKNLIKYIDKGMCGTTDKKNESRIGVVLSLLFFFLKCVYFHSIKKGLIPSVFSTDKRGCRGPHVINLESSVCRLTIEQNPEKLVSDFSAREFDGHFKYALVGWRKKFSVVPEESSHSLDRLRCELLLFLFLFRGIGLGVVLVFLD